MEFHSIALFFHIVGGLGLFVALGLEWTSLRQIRSAILPEQVRAWMGIIKSASRLVFVSMLASTITGIISMLIEDGLTAWITVTLGSLFMMIVLGRAVTGPRMAAIGRTLSADKRPISQTTQILASTPLLWISLQIRVTIALGIVFLMTVKPGLVGSLLVIGVAIVLGLASALPVFRRERAQEGPAD